MMGKGRAGKWGMARMVADLANIDRGIGGCLCTKAKKRLTGSVWLQ